VASILNHLISNRYFCPSVSIGRHAGTMATLPFWNQRAAGGLIHRGYLATSTMAFTIGIVPRFQMERGV
jgi:type III secretory pathway component EscT